MKRGCCHLRGENFRPMVLVREFGMAGGSRGTEPDLANAGDRTSSRNLFRVDDL
jgi:hypothetical protein